MMFSEESSSPLCINCGTSVCTHISYKCLYVPTTFKPHFCSRCGGAFQTQNKWLPRLDFKPRRIWDCHSECKHDRDALRFYEDLFMTLHDLTVTASHYNKHLDAYRQIYYKTNPSAEPTVMSVSIMNSTFNREFVEKTFALVADGKKVTQLEVLGRDIGSNVLGGAQMYFLQFA